MKVICLYLSSARLSHRVCLLGCPLTTDPVEGQRRLSSNLHQSPCSGRKKIPRSNTCEMFIIVITLIIHEIIGIRCCLLPPPPLLSEEHLAKKMQPVRSSDLEQDVWSSGSNDRERCIIIYWGQTFLEAVFCLKTEVEGLATVLGKTCPAYHEDGPSCSLFLELTNRHRHP